MITVQLAEPRHVPQMTALWCSVFGDSETFVRAFYACEAMHARALIALDGGTVAGIAHLLPVTVRTEEGSRAAEYLYACAVLPAYRCRGIFRQMLTEIKARCTEKRCPLILIPGGQSLFAYYEAQGFIRVPVRSEVMFTPRTASAPEAEFEELTPELYHRIRAKSPEASACRVLWSPGQLAFLTEDQVQSGGFAYAVRIGGETAAVLGSRQGDALYLTELAAPARLRDAVLSALAAYFPCEHITYRTEPGAPDGTQRFGMMLPLPDFCPESLYFPIDLI